MPVKNEKNQAIIPSHAVHIGRWKKYLAVGTWLCWLHIDDSQADQ